MKKIDKVLIKYLQVTNEFQVTVYKFKGLSEYKNFQTIDQVNEFLTSLNFYEEEK